MSVKADQAQLVVTPGPQTKAGQPQPHRTARTQPRPDSRPHPSRTSHTTTNEQTTQGAGTTTSPEAGAPDPA